MARYHPERIGRFLARARDMRCVRFSPGFSIPNQFNKDYIFMWVAKLRDGHLEVTNSNTYVIAIIQTGVTSAGVSGNEVVISYRDGRTLVWDIDQKIPVRIL